MDAPRRKRLGILVFIFFLLLFLPCYGFGQDENLRIWGYYQFTSDFNNGIANPNNKGLQPDIHNNFKLLRQKFQIEADYKASPILTLHAQARFFHDFTDDLDKDKIREYNSYPRNFTGNGWLLRGGGVDGMAELRELFAEVKLGNWWWRLGKQQVGWGESLGFRVLDQVNPLDLSQQFLNQRVYDEFDNLRIPQWMVRGVYKFPAFWIIPDLSAEVVFNPGDVVPTILPAQGSPYNPTPTFITLKEKVPRGDPIWGGRLEGTVKGVYLTLNYISKPVDDGVPKFRTAVVDPLKGELTEIAPGFFLPLRFIMDARHPRANMVGGSFTFEQQSLGLVWHGEVACWLDYPYMVNPEILSEIDDRSVLKLFLGVDKNVYLLPRSVTESSLVIGLQVLQTHIMGNTSRILTNTGETPYKRDELFGIVLQQPFLNKNLLAEVSYFYDTRGSYHFQPGLRYEWGDHWIFELYYNKFGGSYRGQAFGSLARWANDVFFQVTYGFSEGFKIGKGGGKSSTGS